MGAVFTALSAGLMANALSESNRSGRGVQQASTIAAAEAGVNDYIAKLTEDHAYFAHYVHIGESTRKGSTTTTTKAGLPWPAASGATWTYPNGRDAWRPLDNGFEFNLQITPPSAGSQAVKIVSTGRKTGSTTNLRSVEVFVRPASLTDFQMVSNADVSYGSTATTRGKLYAGIDAGGTKHNINHAGKAYGDLYAEGSVSGSPTYYNGAKAYGSSTIRSIIPNPINFNTFASSLVDLKAAAQATGGLYLDDSTKDAWRLTFNANGTITVASCKKATTTTTSHGNTTTIYYDIAESPAPTCTTTSTPNMPASGAIYVNQSVIVSGIVKGQVTVASNDDVIIGNGTSYVTPGVDVLGLIAKNDMTIAEYVDNDLTWSAATIAQTGYWRSYTGATSGSHGTMTFSGSTSTNLGGSMGMFDYRNYNYDSNLLYLQPPFFPYIADTYTVLSFRELTP